MMHSVFKCQKRVRWSLTLSDRHVSKLTSVNWRQTLPIFRELGFAPIGAKFPPIAAPHVPCTVKKFFKNILKTFLVIVVLIYLSYFCVKNRFLNSYYEMLWTIFHLFQYCNFTTYCYSCFSLKFGSIRIRIQIRIWIRIRIRIPVVSEIHMNCRSSKLRKKLIF